MIVWSTAALCYEVLLQGRKKGTLTDLPVKSPRPGTGGGLRTVLCSVTLTEAAR